MTNILIDSDKKLNNLLIKLGECSEIGLDTEFIRESTYRPILALVQISLPNGEIYLIDPQKITNIQAIIDITTNPNILKIIHSAKQDLEALYSFTGIFPVNIFDTQIAFNFLSEKSSIGYSALVKNICDVDIKEGSWRTDWLKRPLTQEKIEYAADDVKYLIKIKNQLEKNLKIINRYTWFQEEQEIELKKSNIIVEPDYAWEKINYPLYFDSSDLNLLKKIASWRERLSIKYDVPKRWILSDSHIIKIMIASENKVYEIISNMKQSIENLEMNDLKNLLSLRKKIKNKNLLPKKDIEQKCNDVLSYVSDEFKIDPTIIANKRDMEMFVLTNNKARFMKGWRYQIFGKLVQ
tara:strand:- start:4193 stop:5245 length:1053 start_codon:yes stop_codon:yes gene_type:complete